MPTTTTGTATSFITFSRASTATRVNASGLVEAVASGTARIDYDPVTLAAKGLLVEEQRTNLFLQSTFASAWTGGAGAVLTANNATAPDGTTTAAKIDLSTTANSAVYQVNATTGTLTMSVWLRGAVGGETVKLQYYTAAPVASGASSTFTLTTSWQRYTYTATVGGNAYWYVMSDNTTAKTVYAWGAQLEAGSFPTSYIPTTSASVTRSADVASVATSAFPYSATAGTLVVKATANNYPSAASGGLNPHVVALTPSGDGSNSIRILRAAGAVDPLFRVMVAGVDVALVSPATTSTWPNGTTRSVAIAWAANDFAMSIGGGAVATDTAGALPSVNTLGIGSLGTSAHFNGHIRQITYIPRRLTDAELQARTA